jgi:hypothetical protein
MTTLSATKCASIIADDNDEDEDAEGSKAAPPVNAQDSYNHEGDIKGQEVEGSRRNQLLNRHGTLPLAQLRL